MSTVVILVTVLAVGVVVALLLRDGHPENGCSHGVHPTLSDVSVFTARSTARGTLRGGCVARA